MAVKIERVNCNICQSSHYKTIYTKFDLNLIKCKNCGLIYANPRLLESDILKRYSRSYFYDEYLPTFGATANEFDMELIRNQYLLYLNLITKYFAPGKKLLDVGCGPGFFLKAAEELGWDTEGIEISEAASEYANHVVKVNVHKGKLEDIDFPTETFDLVTLLDVIEHLMDPLHTLREINRILKKEGILILNTPDYKSLSRLFLGKDWAVLSPAEHLYYFTQKTLCNLLSKANFRVLGFGNLLDFNPEYTHNKSKRSYLLWKDYHMRLEEKEIMKKIHAFEQADLLAIGEEKSRENPPQRFTGKMKGTLYKWAKSWVRGDVLVAVAKKI